MSVEALRLSAAALLGLHGLGHILGLFPILGFPLTDEHSSRSWLLTPILGNFLSSLLQLLIFLAATLSFLGAAMALFNWQIVFVLWQLLSIFGAALSLFGLVMYPRSFPTLFPNVIGALVVDLGVLAALLWLRWPLALVGLLSPP